jgi:SPP1 gp7 family putative phage head morphogenesis protein
MPETVNLGFAIGLPPKKAIEYFQAKGYTFSWDWHDTWQEAHAKAFTVAKVMRMDILQDIHDAVDKAISNGQTFAQFRDGLEPLLKAKGWWGKQMLGDGTGGAASVQLGSPRRLLTIYRTNLQTAYMAGRYKQQMEDVDNRPFWQYVAIMDDRTRPAHAALNGKIFQYDDPFWNNFYPPNGWNCRCRVRALSAKNVERRGLNIEDSSGRITDEARPLSQSSEIYKKVSVYKDPRTHERIATDVGWDYNPGKAAWYPDLDGYDYDVAKSG